MDLYTVHWNQSVTNAPRVSPNRNAFKSRLKCPNSISGCLSEAGRLFQILGPASDKLLSPSRVFVLGTVRTLAWVERSWGDRSLRSAGSRRLGTMQLDLAANCRREWPACSRPAASYKHNLSASGRCGLFAYWKCNNPSISLDLPNCRNAGGEGRKTEWRRDGDCKTNGAERAGREKQRWCQRTLSQNLLLLLLAALTLVLIRMSIRHVSRDTTGPRLRTPPSRIFPSQQQLPQLATTLSIIYNSRSCRGRFRYQSLSITYLLHFVYFSRSWPRNKIQS